MVAIGVMLSYFINREPVRHCVSTLLSLRLVGVGLHMADSPSVWRIPFGLQLVPAGLMLLGLFTVKVYQPSFCVR